MTLKTPITHDQVFGASQADRSHIVGPSVWFTQFNMRVKKTQDRVDLEQVPRKKVVVQIGTSSLTCS